MRRLYSSCLRDLTSRPGVLRLAAGALLLVAVAGGASLAWSHQSAGRAAPAPAPTDTPTVTPTTTPTPAATPVPPPPPPPPLPQHYYGGSGAGAYFETGMTLVIPKLGVQASVSGRRVGGSGVMADPAGPWDVAWYDFSDFHGIGGYPTEPDGNAVFSGHVNYVGVGLAVFGGIDSLTPGDIVTVHTPEGSVTYSIQSSEWVTPDVDFTRYIARGAPGSITLITCIGTFSGGEYSHRLVVRGTRI